MTACRLNSAERGAFDLSTLPVRQIERIEVLRGAGAALPRSDAVGGVISITTRRPEAAGVPALDGSLTAGSHGTSAATRVGIGGDRRTARGSRGYSRLRSTDDFSFQPVLPTERRPSARLRNLPPPSEPSVHTRLNAGFVEDSGLLSGGFDLGPSARLEEPSTSTARTAASRAASGGKAVPT